MSRFGRRDLLKGIAGLPVAAALHPLAGLAASSTRRRSPAAPPVTKLNLIFHGLFAFIVWEDVKQIEILPPLVVETDPASSHQYLAGGRKRGDLYDLAQGQQYWLEGIVPGKLRGGVKTRNNSVFHEKKNIDRLVPFCSYVLDFPDQIFSLRCIQKENDQDFYTSNPLIFTDPEFLPLMHVFTYQVKDAGKLSLAPFAHAPTDNGDGTAYLHIRAEAPTAHASDAYDRLNDMIQGLNIELNPYYHDFIAAPDQNGLPLGVVKEDECFLAELPKYPNCFVPSDYQPTGVGNNYKLKGPMQAMAPRPSNCHSIFVINS
jgi:hypothetical protein